MQNNQDYALRMIEERRVRLVRLWFTDVLGQLKSVAISPVELPAAFEDGVQFDGTAIDGYSRVQEVDVLAMPDAASFQLMGWADGGEVTARMFCDLVNLDGSPFEGDPRQVLQRNVARARDAGFTLMCAPEVEYFYFRAAVAGANGPEPLDRAGYFDLTSADSTSDLRRATINRLENIGIPVEYAFHEDAPSQHEIDLRYTDVLTMADNLMTLRHVVREVALEHGVHATFMPKPLAGVQGSGMHTHLSLWDDDVNRFYDEAGEYHLSDEARSFIAGLLRHGPDITAVTNQLVNSYKRLVPGFEAPVHVAWARANRSAMIRVPVPKRNKADHATRIEYRSIDPACNPYLAFSLILAAGLDGVSRGEELEPEAATDIFSLSADERRARTPRLLPSSLAEALDRMEQSELVRETLGEHIFEWFLRNKRDEWNEYKGQVTQFELDQYLGAW